MIISTWIPLLPQQSPADICINGAPNLSVSACSVDQRSVENFCSCRDAWIAKGCSLPRTCSDSPTALPPSADLPPYTPADPLPPAYYPPTPTTDPITPQVVPVDSPIDISSPAAAPVQSPSTPSSPSSTRTITIEPIIPSAPTPTATTTPNVPTGSSSTIVRSLATIIALTALVAIFA